MTMTVEQITARLDVDQITTGARYAFREAMLQRVGRVILEPGDATRYEITVVAPGRRWEHGTWTDHDQWLVILWDRAFPWIRLPLDPYYCADKWTADGRLWTGVVLSLFLQEIAGLELTT